MFHIDQTFYMHLYILTSVLVCDSFVFPGTPIKDIKQDSIPFGFDSILYAYFIVQ